MKTKLQIALASACGAVIGYGLATSFLTGVWVVLASVIGGGVGWVMFDPASLAKTFTVVASQAAKNMRLSFVEFKAEPWRKILPQALLEGAEMGVIFHTIGVFVLYFIFIISAFIKVPMVECATILFIGTLSIALMCLLMGTMGFGMAIIDKDERRKRLQRLGEKAMFENTSLKTVLLKYNVITLPFTLSYYLAKALAWLGKRMPIVLMFCWVVTVKTCVLAHNNGRLACFVGASFGTFGGLFVGHLLGAMISGAAIGWFAHYIGAFFPRAYVALITQQLHKSQMEQPEN